MCFAFVFALPLPLPLPLLERPEALGLNDNCESADEAREPLELLDRTETLRDPF